MASRHATDLFRASLCTTPEAPHRVVRRLVRRLALNPTPSSMWMATVTEAMVLLALVQRRPEPIQH